MFESHESSALTEVATPAVARVRSWLDHLTGSSFDTLDDSARIELIRALEDLKSAASAAQARVSVDFDVSQRAAQRATGVPAERVGLGVGAQIALARRESPHRGGRYLGLARALVHEMPHTLAALSTGVLSEWRATLLVRESACLTREDRATFDQQLAAEATALVGLGDRALVARARAVTQRLDVAAVVARARRAATERCVTIRPAPDTMTYLTALLPVAQGVAVYAALARTADTARATGDPRSRGQVMADELVARIATRPAGAAAPDAPPPARLEVQLVMTDRTLLAGDDEPAYLPGYGTVPGPWARQLVLDTLHPADESAGSPPGTDTPRPGRDPLARAQVWVRRLFTAPTTGQLIAMDSRARLAPRGLGDLIRARDGTTCRTPWCDAPVRHVDHITPAAAGGPTDAANLQGLCEACNHAKEAPGWSAGPARPTAPAPMPGRATAHRRPDAAPDHALNPPPDVLTTTPTGHQYLSRAPALPGAPDAPSGDQTADDDVTSDRAPTDPATPNAPAPVVPAPGAAATVATVAA